MKVNIYQSDEFIEPTEIVFNSNSYIVAVDCRIIGHFNVLEREDYVIIDYELVRSCRNKGLSDTFIDIIENYIYENFDFDKYVMLIRYDNERSMHIAKKHGYSIYYSLTNKMSSEMSSYNAYSKQKQLHKTN